jgi:hypothetical protein
MPYNQIPGNDEKFNRVDELAHDMRMPCKFADSIMRNPDRVVAAFDTVIDTLILEGEEK